MSDFNYEIVKNPEIFEKYPKITKVYKSFTTAGMALAVYEEFIPFFGISLLAYYFENDVKGFYHLMHETFGKYWVKIINDCENSYTLQLAYGHKYEKIYDLIRLKYNLMIVNSFFKNNTDKEYEREVLKGYFNCHYPQDSNSKKIIDHKIKILDKKYPIKK